MSISGTNLLYFIGMFVVLTTTSATYAQIYPKHEIGIREYSGFYAQKLPEGDRYRPYVIAPYYHIYLSKKDAKSKLGIYFEPQLTLVNLDYSNHIQTDNLHTHEYGFNAGLSYSYWWKRMAIYIGLGSGPNFITVHTERQASGFIFSDNLYLGIKERIFKTYYLDLHCRGRHISNAGLKDPNNGINNVFAGLGISRIF